MRITTVCLVACAIVFALACSRHEYGWAAGFASLWLVQCANLLLCVAPLPLTRQPESASRTQKLSAARGSIP